MGLFVTFEGGEGSGKSTQARRLAEKLESAGIDYVLTKEPGGLPETEILRNRLLHPTRKLSALGELVLFEADRVLHVDAIYQWLEEGKVVISDRYIDSTLAYQAYGRGLTPYDVTQFNLAAAQGLLPEVTYYLRLSAEEGVKRALGRPDANTVFDEEKGDFHRRVCQGFDLIERENKCRFVRIDGMLDPDTIERQIWDDLSQRLERR